jgi:hypothetical protein
MADYYKRRDRRNNTVHLYIQSAPTEVKGTSGKRFIVNRKPINDGCRLPSVFVVVGFEISVSLVFVLRAFCVCLFYCHAAFPLRTCWVRLVSESRPSVSRPSPIFSLDVCSSPTDFLRSDKSCRPPIIHHQKSKKDRFHNMSHASLGSRISLITSRSLF